MADRHVMRGYFPVEDLREDCAQAINGCEWLLRTEPYVLAAGAVEYIIIDPTGNRVDEFFTGAHRWSRMTITDLDQTDPIRDYIIEGDDRFVFVDVCPSAARIVRRALESNPVQAHFAKYVVKEPVLIA